MTINDNYCTLRRRNTEIKHISNVRLDPFKVTQVVKSEVKNEDKKKLEDTSDEDDLSHAEELSYSSQVTSTSVESLNSNSNLNNNICLPTGWHRHPGHHHVINNNILGPLDEVINADESEEEDEIYSTVSKIEEKKVAKFHFKIQRRHTTYVKQFDSLPPQATLMSNSSRKQPHVHSWHRYGKHHKIQVRKLPFFKLMQL